jgi:amino acid transporter
LFSKINPAELLFKLPCLKRAYAKKGLTVDDVRAQLDEVHKRPDWGISSIIAGGIMGGLIVLICFGIANLYSGIIQLPLDLEFYDLIAFVVIALVLNYFLLFRRDKYLDYFKEFDKMPREEKRKWAWISSVVIVCILLFFVGSFVFVGYRHSIPESSVAPDVSVKVLGIIIVLYANNPYLLSEMMM